MYVWLKVLPAWRRYLAIARRIVISRAVSLRREDEPVEAVVLGLPAPDPRERVLEHLAHVVRLELGALVVAEPEVVDPDRRPVGGLTSYGRSSLTLTPMFSSSGSTSESRIGCPERSSLNAR